MISAKDVAKHNNADSCWVILHGKVYDVTDFLPDHPGGQKVILKYAGKDATAEFELIHPDDTLEKYLHKNNHLGPVDPSTVQQQQQRRHVSSEELARQERIRNMPALSECFNLLDFEAVARRVMRKGAWAYYSSGADDEISVRENRAAFQQIWFKPRVLVDVSKVDTTATMFGHKVDVPFYVTATALGKLGHAEGEVVLTRAAHKHNIVQMIPTLASCSFDRIVDAAGPGQVLWYQLYVNQRRDITEKLVRHAEERGCKALFITVDAPQLGRREKDMRTKYEDDAAHVQQQQSPKDGEKQPQDFDRSQGAARAISSFIDPGLSWKDIPWFLSITNKMAVVLKGVQRVDDVLRAIDAGVHGVVLSNHGGRQLDTARSGIEVLAEVMPVLRDRGLDKAIETYVDGGVRRASDVIKAVCLGARGVGIGRPFLYAMSAYGQAGVERAMALLKSEMEVNMRLLGVTSVEQMSPDLVDARGLMNHGHLLAVPGDGLSLSAYESLKLPQQKQQPIVKSKLS